MHWKTQIISHRFIDFTSFASVAWSLHLLSSRDSAHLSFWCFGCSIKCSALPWIPSSFSVELWLRDITDIWNVRLFMREETMRREETKTLNKTYLLLGNSEVMEFFNNILLTQKIKKKKKYQFLNLRLMFSFRFWLTISLIIWVSCVACCASAFRAASCEISKNYLWGRMIVYVPFIKCDLIMNDQLMTNDD